MKIIFLLFISFLINSTPLKAQKCAIRDDYNPLNDSLSWVVGKKSNRFEFYIEKDKPNKVYLLISILTTPKLRTTVGDSMIFKLDDGTVIRLQNCKNYNADIEKHKFFLAELEFVYFTLLLPINHVELKKLSKNIVNSMSIHLQASNISAENLLAMLDKKNTSKLVTVNQSNGYLNFDFRKSTKRLRKRMIRNATCALKYIP